jgi:hypothetical protein
MLLDPSDDIVAQLHRERSHGVSVPVGNKADPFVPRDVPFLPKRVEVVTSEASAPVVSLSD